MFFFQGYTCFVKASGRIKKNIGERRKVIKGGRKERERKKKEQKQYLKMSN